MFMKQKELFDYHQLEKSALFRGIPAAEIEAILSETTHRVRAYESGELVFHLFEPAEKIGLILEGRVEVQKSFPNGSQVNVSVKETGELIGPAAVFSGKRRYPCDMMALAHTELLLFEREDLMELMRRDSRILDRLTGEIASAAYMLQERLELFSYSGIAQKAAFWLLMRMREIGKTTIRIPGTMTQWAMRMNVSRPSLHRELRKLEAQGMIACHDHMVDILDSEGLKEILSR